MTAPLSKALRALLDRPEAERRIGPFVLVEQLGSGGFAPVWLAREVYAGTEIRTAAVKLFAFDAPRAQGALETPAAKIHRQRVVSEARALCRVEHPSVVRFYTLLIDDELGIIGLAMEHLSGVALDKRLEDGPISIAQTLDIGIAVASALAAIHASGLIHRDLKPANVIETGGSYKLIDFGIAAFDEAPRAPRETRVVLDDLPFDDASTQLSAILGSTRGDGGAVSAGTVGYVDPATIAEGLEAVPVSDLYALGAMLFECATGTLPAVAAAGAAGGLKGEVLDGRARPPSLGSLVPEAPADFCDLVDAMLDPDRARRPASAEAVAARLTAIRNRQSAAPAEPDPKPIAKSISNADAPPPADPAKPVPPIPSTLRSPARRRLGRAAIGVAGIAALAGALAYSRMRPVVAYCAETVEVWGVETCVVQISESIAHHRSASHRQTLQSGRVVKSELVNGHGVLIADKSDKAGIASLEYVYDAAGRATEVIERNRRGHAVGRRLLSQHGDRVDYVDAAGNPRKLSDTSITGATRMLDEHGLVVSLKFLGVRGAPRPDKNGAFGLAYERDPRGFVTRVTALDEDGRPMICIDGSSAIVTARGPMGEATRIEQQSSEGKPIARRASDGVYREEATHDASGNKLGASFFGRTGEPTYSDSVYGTGFSFDDFGDEIEDWNVGPDGHWTRPQGGYAAGFHFSYDKRGNLTEERELDENKNLLRSAWGAAIFRFTFDEHDQHIEHTSHDRTGALMLDKDGYAREVDHFDDRGRQDRIEFFDTSGAPIRYSGGGLFIAAVEYDEADRVIHWSSLDPSGKPSANKEGEARVLYRYDAHGNELERSSYGSDDKPSTNRNGYAVRRQAFDEDDNLVTRSFFDAAGAPVLLHEGYSSFKAAYNPRGERTEQAFFDANGNPALSLDGFAIRRDAYDRNGRVVESRYFGVDAAPALRRGGYSIAQYRYDEMGRRSSTAYYDTSNKPVVGEDGFATERLTFDDHGHIEDSSYFDAAGKPGSATRGYARLHGSYDARGNESESTFFGADGSPALGPDGYAIRKRRYDAADQIIEEAFFDAQGAAIACKDGFATLRTSYDEDENEIENVYLDARNQPVALKGKKLARRRQAYDDRRNVIEVTWFDAAGAPTAGDGGVAIERHKVDAFGRIVEWSYFDATGTPAKNDDGKTVYRVVYDDRGNRTEERFFDGAGRPTLGPDGYSATRIQYDDKGRRVAESTFDAAGAPAAGKDGVAIRRFVFDARGEMIQTSLFDASGALVHDGVAVEKKAYDVRGKLAEVRLFDAHDAPAERAPGGFQRIAYTYDGAGNLKEKTAFDKAGRKIDVKDALLK